MIYHHNNTIYIWMLDGDSVSIMRIYGQFPLVEVPVFIDGHRVTNVGRYCFADKEQLPAELEKDRMEAMSFTSLRPLCGDYIESVVLPDSVTKIGNYAFYGCSHLKKIECSNELSDTGSDAFLNCPELRNITIRGSVFNRSGVRTMLSQISSDVEVSFVDRGNISAVIFYPEYYEGYDEIGPAHIFGLNIEGEGFRARQCFKDGVLDLNQYDSIFQKASVEESERTLSRMALGRLKHPAGLEERFREQYAEHIKNNGEAVVRRLINNKDLDSLHFMCKTKLLFDNVVEKAISYTADSSWAEGTASLMKWKNEYYGQATRKNYSFDAF